MLTQAPKGTRDMLPQDAYIWQTIEAVMRRRAALAGFREVRTPVFEHTELFLRGVGDTTDIVQKEMYTFKDKGDRSITLKPEGTAGAVRAFLEGKLFADALPCKMYYLNNPVFRYEKPQAGRLREHHQFGMECFGGKEPTVEAELIATLLGILGDLGLKGLSVNINSIGCPHCRPKYHAALKEYLSGRLDQLCPTCRERFDRNPLRVLDCKQEKCRCVTDEAPRLLDYNCPECKEHFDTVLRLLDAAGVKYEIDHRLVRGLDYYCRTTFEVVSGSIGAQAAVAGGGRYDGLVKSVGGPDVPGVGFACGMERLALMLGDEEAPRPDFYAVAMDAQSRDLSFGLVQRLRGLGLKGEMNFSDAGFKGLMRQAGKSNARFCCIMGPDEAADGAVVVKDMDSGEQQTLSLDAAADFLAANSDNGKK